MGKTFLTAHAALSIEVDSKWTHRSESSGCWHWNSATAPSLKRKLEPPSTTTSPSHMRERMCTFWVQPRRRSHLHCIKIHLWLCFWRQRTTKEFRRVGFRGSSREARRWFSETYRIQIWEFPILHHRQCVLCQLDLMEFGITSCQLLEDFWQNRRNPRPCCKMSFHSCTFHEWTVTPHALPSTWTPLIEPTISDLSPTTGVTFSMSFLKLDSSFQWYHNWKTVSFCFNRNQHRNFCGNFHYFHCPTIPANARNFYRRHVIGEFSPKNPQGTKAHSTPCTRRQAYARD